MRKLGPGAGEIGNARCAVLLGLASLTAMERTWPLTGRDEELRRVAASIRPGAAGVVVAGPAGVGKTRLAREALALVGTGVTVVWAHGSTAARPMPLGAFAGLLDLPAGDAAGTIGRALDQLAGRQPLVLAVDDAHLLDEHSAIVLHRVVVRRLAPVLVTLRTGEVVPDIVTALWKDDHLSRLDLGPLDGSCDQRPGRRRARWAGRLRLRAQVVDVDPGQSAVPAPPAGR